MESSTFHAILALAKARDRALSRSTSDEFDEDTDWDIQLCPTSIFRSYQIYRVERWVKWMSETWYLGWGKECAPLWLEGDSTAFLNMARTDSICLEQVAAVWEYVQWYLLITHMRHWDEFILIESVEQPCFRDMVDIDMTLLDRLRKDSFLSHYRSRIRQPHIHRVQQTAMVDVFATHNHDLEHHHLLVSSTGDLYHTITVLETNLPLAVAGYGSRSLITGYTAQEN